ncbi:disulfide bond formation protein B [Candidatus Pelagibacter sp.]|nr:disulfide bond formation protein B [Candidatus Pelagibacter sp.]
MFNLKAKFYLKIIFIFSVIALISAYFIEYVLGHKPCNLCLIERIPYGISIILIISIFILKNNEKFIVLLLILTSIFSFFISVYHFGIEQGFFQESAVCNVKNFTENITKEDLLNQLNERIISCKDVTFRIFGLSLTGINIMINLLFIIFLSIVYKIYEKNKQ